MEILPFRIYMRVCSVHVCVCVFTEVEGNRVCFPQHIQLFDFEEAGAVRQRLLVPSLTPQKESRFCSDENCRTLKVGNNSRAEQ